SFEAIYYTQGIYDFVDVVEASDINSVLGFSLWYAKQGYGKITTMPAFDEAAMEKAVEAV
ncbi:MAG: GYD domain-containing protein, partial [Gammaproteobacteria bacterium]